MPVAGTPGGISELTVAMRLVVTVGNATPGGLQGSVPRGRYPEQWRKARQWRMLGSGLLPWSCVWLLAVDCLPVVTVTFVGVGLVAPPGADGLGADNGFGRRWCGRAHSGMGRHGRRRALRQKEAPRREGRPRPLPCDAIGAQTCPGGQRGRPGIRHEVQPPIRDVGGDQEQRHTRDQRHIGAVKHRGRRAAGLCERAGGTEHLDHGEGRSDREGGQSRPQGQCLGQGSRAPVVQERLRQHAESVVSACWVSGCHVGAQVVLPRGPVLDTLL
eukprot:3718869-Prymnesium_polylepis.1